MFGDPQKASRILNRVGVALQANVRVPRDKGKLARSTNYRLVRTSGVFPLKLQFGSQADYAKYVNVGTRPHEIRPKKNKGVLSWADAQTGERRFAKIVHHPGTKPQPYIGEALINTLGFSRVRKLRAF